MNKISFLIIQLLFVGCASHDLQAQNTSLVKESLISSLSKDEIEMIVGLNSPASKDEPNVYTEAFVKNVAGFKIIHTKKDGEIYILKDKKVILSVYGNGAGVTVYGPHPGAPSFGTEKVTVDEKYLSYRSPNGVFSGSGFVFEDYGLDGIDVKYEFKNTLNAESFLNGKKCERTIVAGAACCTDGSGELRAYRFTPSTGWELATNPKLIANCGKKP